MDSVEHLKQQIKALNGLVTWCTEEPPDKDWKMEAQNRVLLTLLEVRNQLQQLEKTL